MNYIHNRKKCVVGKGGVAFELPTTGETSECLCGASRSPWQLARQASKADPKTLKMYTFGDFTLRYFESFTLREKRHIEERNPGK